MHGTNNGVYEVSKIALTKQVSWDIGKLPSGKIAKPISDTNAMNGVDGPATHKIKKRT